MKLSHVPLRLATGAYVLNSGMAKRGGPPEAADQLHGFASTAYPELKRFRPEQFARLLSTGEIALGVALVTPFVPARLVGAALAAFSAGLVGLYLKVPGMRQQGTVKPTEHGQGTAKDVWMLGIGLSLFIDG